MSRPDVERKVRCAVYTRVSCDERLAQEFNSLDAQREAFAAYVASQRHEGWIGQNDCSMTVGIAAVRLSARRCNG
jgi:hypothetical protein